MKSFLKRFLSTLAIIIGVFGIGIVAFLTWAYMPVKDFKSATYERLVPGYWPTESWQYSTPEEQGMNSKTLLEMMAYYKQLASENSELYIDSMTVIRNGYIVAELYNNPLYPRSEMHVLHSAAKRIVSALVGIAIDQGYLSSVDVPVIELFADRQIKNMDDRKRVMTIRDLLTMQTGLHSRDSHLYAYEGLFSLQHSDDWLQFALDIPMAAKPGERFDYSNISTFLLSTIIMESTGMDTLEFAKQNLFDPLGISDVKWEWNADGQAIAWARMWLKPNDMAKIGLLYLQQGEWNGKQILPAEWVRDSLNPSAYPGNSVDVLNTNMSKNREASIRNWVGQRFIRPFADGYGYQWWLDRKGYYTALGTNGQYITVAPKENLVFVVTAKCSGSAQFTPAELFYDYILSAVESESPLARNPAAVAELAVLAGPPALSQQPSAISALPQIAMDVSGMTYSMEVNPFNTDNIRFIFDSDKPYAELSYTAREGWNVDYRIGLDNVYRFTKTNDGNFAARGAWTTANTFSLEVEIVGYSSFDTWQFTFDGDQITVTEFSITGDYTYNGIAK